MKYLSSIDLLKNDIEQVKRIEFTTDAGAQTAEPGALYWASDSHTLSLGTINGSSLEIGQEIVFPIINQTGSTIPNGAAIGYAGALGASPIMKGKLYLADGNEPDAFFLGIATHDILNGNIGHVTVFGRVRGIDTTGASVGETWSAGDILWASSTVPGALTNVKPTAPNLKINIAAILSVHAQQGMIEVRPTFAGALSDLDNVNLSSIADKHMLYYNNANSRWENSSVKTINGESILGSGDIEAGGGGNMIVQEVKSSYTLSSAGDTVPIGIAEFDSSKDFLFVYVNSVYDADYTISGTNIVKNSGTWDSGTIFNFVALVPAEMPESATATTIKRETFVATAGQTVFNLTGGNYAVGSSQLDAYVNGVRQPSSAYVETDSNTITFVSGLTAGDMVFCQWFESVTFPFAVTTHAGTHKSGGSDPLIASDFNAADINHNHDSDYADISHNHDSDYADISHNHDSDYADILHNHDSDYADIAHNHNSDYLSLSGGILTGPLTVKQIVETFVKSTSAWTGTVTLNAKTASGFYNTANATANFSINFRGDATTTLNSLIADGELITITVLVTNGATPYYPTAYNIDGAPITVKWADGSAPTSGNANSIDAYTFAFIDTGGSIPICLGSRTKFA